MTQSLREGLFNAVWRCGFAPHEDPATVEKMKAEWPEDVASAQRRADATLSTFRQWLEARHGCNVDDVLDDLFQEQIAAAPDPLKEPKGEG